MADATRIGSTVGVTIFGRTYHLRGDGQSDHLARIAGRVDRTMKEIAEQTGTADTLKVAILAALNIADEATRGPAGEDFSRETEECLDRCLQLVDTALENAPETATQVD